MGSTPHRSVKERFNQTGRGRDDIAATLARFYAGEEDGPLALVYTSIYRKGFLVAPAKINGVPVVSFDGWTTGTIDEAATAAQNWLDGLAEDRRTDFHCGYPPDDPEHCRDHGFRVMTDIVPNVARIIPALV